MRHLDLFAGIGGFSLAAQWMGWEVVAQVEWDEWCQRVLLRNFPDALRFGDIVEFNKMLKDGKIITDNDKRCFPQSEKQIQTRRDIIGNSNKQSARLGRIDIITGGFPCQPFSHAGKRKGTDDSRYLWPEMLTTIRILKPSFVVGENVAGLVSMENGKTLDNILSDLANEGYTTEQFIIPACAIGAWHRRDRIWIVAYANTSSNGITRQNRKSIEIERTGQTIDESIRRGQLKAIQYEGLDDLSQYTTDSRLLGQEISKEQTTGIEQYCENAPNSGSQGLQGTKQRGNNEEKIKRRTKGAAGTITKYSCNAGEYWQSEPSVGRVANGIPIELDGYWDREPEGIPRVSIGIKDRVNRLKGLGNAIVPAVAFELFKAIEQFAYSENKE